MNAVEQAGHLLMSLSNRYQVSINAILDELNKLGLDCPTSNDCIRAAKAARENDDE